VFAGLAVATTYMAVFGGLGVLGAVRYVRCPACGHLTAASGSGVPESCPRCRHVVLFHPLHTLHALHALHRRTHVGAEGGSGLPQHAVSGAPHR
jgi:phage FluMu protein Com